MSTRCNIEITSENGPKNPVILYHHSDGYPKFQLPKLVKFLDESYRRLKALGYGYWWDEETVAAMLIALSMNKYEEPSLLSQDEFDSRVAVRDRSTIDPMGYPVYQPCGSRHGDIAFLYSITLGQKEGEFKIVANKVLWPVDRARDEPRLVRVGLLAGMAGAPAPFLDEVIKRMENKAAEVAEEHYKTVLGH